MPRPTRASSTWRRAATAPSIHLSGELFKTHDRHLHGPLPVPRLGPGAARPDRRHHGPDVRQPAVGAAADQGRQARWRWPSPAASAAPRCPSVPTIAEAGAGQGLRGELVVRPARAGRHAAGHRQPRPAGNREGAGDAGAEGAAACRRARSRAATRRRSSPSSSPPKRRSGPRSSRPRERRSTASLPRSGTAQLRRRCQSTGFRCSDPALEQRRRRPPRCGCA